MKTDLDSRLNEAEVCRSMGLYDEAIEIYQKILNGITDQDSQIAETVNEKINDLKREITDRDHAETEKVTAEDISVFKKTLATQEGDAELLGDQTLLDSAESFKELGLYNEAVSEYEKIIIKKHPFDEIASGYLECLLKVHSPGKILKYTDKFISKNKIDKKTGASIKQGFAKELEKRDHQEPAHELYKSATTMNPEDSALKKKVNAIKTTSEVSSKYDYLLKDKKVTTEQLQKAFALSKKMKKSVEFILIGQYGIKKSDIAKSFEAYYGCKFMDYDTNIPTPLELLTNLKQAFLINEGWVPLSWDKNYVEVLVDDPKDLNKTDNIKTLLNTPKINFSVAVKEDIEEYIKRFFDTDQIEMSNGTGDGMDDFDLIPDVSFEEEEEEEIVDESDESSSKVVKLVDQCLIAAYRKNASDIHIEPSPVTKATNIRFRMDGVCQEYLKVPNSMARGILSRIKIMSQLDIAERRLPQDGKIKFKRKGIPAFELRVATLPTAGGFEDAVMRILAKAGAMSLDDMGMTERNLSILKSVIVKPYGLVLCVGPTGSGKTTTLHSALGYINKPGIKIWTAEDPVEITQPGLRQVEAKPRIGLDFARIMRAFLRADPDVIMIGEMRDEETASIGIEASLTGHLVFSTLHTNSAPETITRLLDMGLNALNFSDAFLGVLAQRLVRRLCKNCAEEYNPSKEEFMEIVEDYGRDAFKKTKTKYSSEFSLKKPGNCGTCSGTGYKGRLGIHELMEGTPTIKALIKRQATTEELFKQAEKESMTTLKQDGIIKAFQGITDFREVRRVCIS